VGSGQWAVGGEQKAGRGREDFPFLIYQLSFAHFGREDVHQWKMTIDK